MRILCLLCFFLLALSGWTGVNAQLEQLTIGQTERELNNLFGVDKLIALNRLTKFYQIQQPRKSMRYGKQAVSLGENIFSESNEDVDPQNLQHLIQAYFQLGELQYEKENFFESRQHLIACKTLSEQLNDQTFKADLEKYLSEIQGKQDQGEVKQNFFSKTFGELKVGEVITGASQDIAIQTEIKLGQASERKDEFVKAHDHYQKALNLSKNKGESKQIEDLQLKIAFVLEKMNRHEEANKLLEEAISEIEKDRDIQLEDIQLDTLPALVQVYSEDSIRKEQQNYKELAESYARENDFEKSLAYYKLYQQLTEKMVADSLQTQAEFEKKAQEFLLLTQQKQIAELNVEAAELEKDKQIRIRNTSLLIGLLILIGTLVTLYFYVTKRKEHKRLTIAYRDLDKTKGKLVNAEKRIITLLKQQVSGDIAQELLMNQTDKLVERRFVCIMFLDIRDFTPMAEKLSPEELIDYQNNVFGFMIDVVQKHHGNINQLLGDGFMATFGAPVSHGNDCQNAFLAAKEILQEVKERSQAGVIPKTKVGIGLHAGFVVTGNVGTEARKQYSVTGNPVIIASRVEQLNKTYKSQLIITEEVYTKLAQPLKLNQPFLEVEVKGRSHPVKILKIA